MCIITESFPRPFLSLIISKVNLLMAKIMRKILYDITEILAPLAGFSWFGVLLSLLSWSGSKNRRQFSCVRLLWRQSTCKGNPAQYPSLLAPERHHCSFNDGGFALYDDIAITFRKISTGTYTLDLPIAKRRLRYRSKNRSLIAFFRWRFALI